MAVMLWHEWISYSFEPRDEPSPLLAWLSEQLGLRSGGMST